jgi:hypothetical protein
MAQLTVRIDEDLTGHLQNLARQVGKSTSDVVRSLVERYVREGGDLRSPASTRTSSCLRFSAVFLGRSWGSGSTAALRFVFLSRSCGIRRFGPFGAWVLYGNSDPHAPGASEEVGEMPEE